MAVKGNIDHQKEAEYPYPHWENTGKNACEKVVILDEGGYACLNPWYQLHTPERPFPAYVQRTVQELPLLGQEASKK